MRPKLSPSHFTVRRSFVLALVKSEDEGWIGLYWTYVILLGRDLTAHKSRDAAAQNSHARSEIEWCRGRRSHDCGIVRRVKEVVWEMERVK